MAPFYARIERFDASNFNARMAFDSSMVLGSPCYMVFKYLAFFTLVPSEFLPPLS